MAAHGFFGEREQIVPFKCNGSSYLGGWRKKAKEGEGGCGLTGAGLSDKAQGLAWVDLEGDIPDCWMVVERYG